ncbi:hypothetical protein GCM10022251_28070 [Phytohabitans flavus]|uniref:PknH-like extracellular domain-containing protein n=1 Tax=Phytohabitans flavus TaxID=1076124 RepID=A0A6F8XP42_9ACTN|nr:hypothetical protein [Phytohabitans flavus]BCB75580.1 hypothetical protein Pflav_019900 [Phytohabitans flavus]
MSELDQAYRALSHEADTMRLATPEALRARADRRNRVRVTAAAVAAAIAVGSAVVGTQWVFRADGTSPAPLPPGATSSPTPPAPTSAPPTSASPTPQRATTAPPTTPSGNTAPKSIPNSAFLQVADTNGREPVVDTPSDDVLPALCDATYASDRSIDLQRSRRVTYWTAPGREGYVPDGTFRQSIRVYEPGRASRFVDELRDAVAACPSDGDRRYRTVSAPKQGDQSLMFEVRYPTKDPEGNPTGGDDVRLVSVVRIGDVVTILYETGWEAGWSAEPDVVNAFTDKAVDRIRSWLD